MARLTTATTPEELSQGRELWREYARVVDDPAWFPGFESELAELGTTYGPPGGTFLLAWEGSDLAACGALRRLDSDTAEVRRVYVRPKFRGRGLARTISMALMGEARRLGYAVVRLDVPPKLAEGIKLYQSLGFSPIPAYAAQPPGAVCMEARVRSGPRRT
jgi:GNAT superfamily N-acetyltransferase